MQKRNTFDFQKIDQQKDYDTVLKYKNRKEYYSLPPNERDYHNTTSLLRDFGIKSVEIPSFDTRGQLFKWRKELIFDSL